WIITACCRSREAPASASAVIWASIRASLKRSSSNWRRYESRKNRLPASSISGIRLTARIRVVSEARGRKMRSLNLPARRSSTIGEAVTCSVQRFDCGELAVHHAELAAQALDVAVDCAVVDEHVVWIGRIHQLVA